MVIAPMDCADSLSKTGLNVVPPSEDFQTPPEAAPTKTVVLPPSFRAATAAMRPLIVADPMLRAFNPEITPESNPGARPAGGAGAAAAAAACAAPDGGRIVLPTGVPAGGDLKTASSTSTLTSVRSLVIRLPRGRPGRPESIENGSHTPATCS